MRWRVRAGAAAIVVAATLALGGSPAAGHALLVASDPPAGSSLSTPPNAVTLTFSEEPDPPLSDVKVLDSKGASVTTGPVTAVEGDPRQLQVPIRSIAQGAYTVSWRTVSRVDGHLATGSFGFAIGVSLPSSAPGSAAAAFGGGTSSLSPIAVLARWLFYLGIIGLLGGSAIALFVIDSPARWTRVVLSAAWLLSAVGTAGIIGSQVADAGVGLTALTSSSLGLATTLRAVPMLACGLSVLALVRGLARTAALWAVAITASAAMVADAVTSHAAAGTGLLGSPAPINVAIQWLHLAAVGVWMGGLAMFLVSVRGRRPGDQTAAAARRFAWVGTVGILTVSLTGVLRALSELTAIDQLWTTGFGLLLVGKTALLGGLAVLGAINHYRNVPMAGGSLSGLRRTGSTELVVAATVLLLSASLVNLAPPSSSVAARSGPPGPLVATGHDFGTSVNVRLQITPGDPGRNQFRLTIRDFDTGHMVALGDSATLRFVLPSRTDIGASSLTLHHALDDAYVGGGLNLSIEGRWQITALVDGPNGPVDVPLTVTTRGAASAPTVQVNAAPGQPTIYTVRYASGASVQVYVDPGKAGAIEVHVTFFDASGKEAPVPTTTMSLARSGEPILTLKPRILEPGHFVADATLHAGTYTLSFAGTPPSGASLSAQLYVSVTP